MTLRLERRADPRISIEQAGKVYDPRSRKFYPCEASNVSRGGALLKLDHRLPVGPGDRVMLGVGSGPSDALLHATEMLEAEVVRSLTTTDDRQGLGVRFVHAEDVTLNLAA